MAQTGAEAPQNGSSQSHNPDAARHSLGHGQPPTREQLLEQYALVGESLDYVGLVLAAVLINYYTVDVQKQQIAAALDGAADPFEGLDLFPLQISSAVMILSASSFFFGISQEAVRQPVDAAASPAVRESLQINNGINSIILLAAAMRIYSLLLLQSAPAAAEETIAEEPAPAAEAGVEESLP